jgi:hypothetical protein
MLLPIIKDLDLTNISLDVLQSSAVVTFLPREAPHFIDPEGTEG